MKSKPESEAAWFRHLWPWLLMLPPLAAVCGGVTMIWLATHTPAPLVVEDYARIEELTAARFARDELAAASGIEASARIERRDDGTTALAITLASDTSAGAPQFLRVRFRHVTEASLDREITAYRDANLYRAEADLGSGTYVVEMEPPEATWRIATRLRDTDEFVELRAGAPGR